jgi:hypothetical protein
MTCRPTRPSPFLCVAISQKKIKEKPETKKKLYELRVRNHFLSHNLEIPKTLYWHKNGYITQFFLSYLVRFVWSLSLSRNVQRPWLKVTSLSIHVSVYFYMWLERVIVLTHIHRFWVKKWGHDEIFGLLDQIEVEENRKQQDHKCYSVQLKSAYLALC